MSFIGKLDFKKSEKTRFADGRKLLEAKLGGKFTREELSKGINAFAKEFNSKDVQIGISAHYKKVNKWTPALISSSAHKIAVWDSSDSPETEEAYQNDTIDYIHVFAIESKNYDNKSLHLRGKH